MTKARSLSDFIESDGSVTLVDNQKIKVGTGNDLEIYHDGSHSFIYDGGVGDLKLQATNLLLEATDGTNYIHFADDGAVRLYYNGLTKLTTTSTGVDVTGSITSDGLTVNSSEVLFDNTSSDFTLKLNTGSVSDKNEVIMGDSGTPLAKFGVGGTANDIITGSDGQDFNIGTAGGGRAINFSTNNFAGVEMKLDSGKLMIGSTNTGGILGIADGDSDASEYGVLQIVRPLDHDGKHHVCVVQSGHEIGGIGYIDNNSGALTFSRGATVNNNHCVLLDSDNSTVLNTNGGERLRITSDGRIGTNTSNPQVSTHGIHINHASAEGTPSFPLGEPLIVQRNFNSSQGCDIAIIGGSASHSAVNFGDKDDSDAGKIEYGHSSNSLKFFTNSSTSEALVIDSTSTVYVGATSGDSWNATSGKFVQLGDTYPIGATNNSIVCILNRTGSDGVVQEFKRDGTVTGSVSTTTTSTTYNTTSDSRLKTDIEPIKDSTEKLMSMNPVEHKWKSDQDADAVHGFIAQEMQKIVPEAVSGDPEGEEMMSMDYGRITPIIVGALQDAHSKIIELENKLKILEGK